VYRAESLNDTRDYFIAKPWQADTHKKIRLSIVRWWLVGPSNGRILGQGEQLPAQVLAGLFKLLYTFVLFKYQFVECFNELILVRKPGFQFNQAFFIYLVFHQYSLDWSLERIELPDKPIRA